MTFFTSNEGICSFESIAAQNASNALFLPIILGFVVFFTSIELARADDLCNAACQKKYTKCQKDCSYDVQCLANCQAAHTKCLNECGGGTSYKCRPC